MDTNSQQDLASLFKTETKRKYSAGEVILNGEEPPGVFYIKNGFVQVYSISDAGDKYLHIIYKHGELFPLIWALNNIKRQVFYEALTNIELLLMPRDNFLTLIKNDIKASNGIMFQLAEQFYVYADRINNLEFKSARERVIYRLLFLANRFGNSDKSRIIIEAPVTHELIAESINLTRETVSREIEQLERSDLVSYKDHLIVLNHVPALEKLVGESIRSNPPAN